jgi:hypothetical protein
MHGKTTIKIILKLFPQCIQARILRLTLMGYQYNRSKASVVDCIMAQEEAKNTPECGRDNVLLFAFGFCARRVLSREM